MKNAILVLTCVVLTLCSNIHSRAQSENYTETPEYLYANSFWAFYVANGLSFASGAPVYVSTAVYPLGGLNEHEGVSAVSNPRTGALLFYSDGRRVWNADHQVMPNGTGLYGNYNTNSVQGTCIVPVIGDENKYYLFSMGTTYDSLKGLYYNIIDMTLENGKGDIVAGQKNIPLDTATLFNEVMVAIPGNNCNVWLLTHTGTTPQPPPFSGQANEYLAFEITSTGVGGNPVISQGLYHCVNESYHLSVSPDRSKIMMTAPAGSGIMEMVFGAPTFSELSLFDANTGSVSNSIPIGNIDPFYAPYTSAFSPNSEVVYFTQLGMVNGGLFLTQLDVSSMDSASVNSSAVHINMKQTSGIGYHAALKLYNDSIFVFYNNSDSIGKINNPNSLGLTCDYQSNVIQLPAPYKTRDANAPGEVVYPSSLVTDVIDTAFCFSDIGSPTILRPNIITGNLYQWNDGSSDSILTVMDTGVYWVSYRYSDGHCIVKRTDTIKVGVINMPVPMININVDILGTSLSYSTYQWIFNGSLIQGATDSTYTATQNGDYRVIVTNEQGCVDTSEIYKVDNRTSIYSVTSKDYIKIFPNPTSDLVFIDSKEDVIYSLYTLEGKKVLANQKGKSISLKELAAGVYLLEIIPGHYQPPYFTRVVKLNMH